MAEDMYKQVKIENNQLITENKGIVLKISEETIAREKCVYVDKETQTSITKNDDNLKVENVKLPVS